MPLISICPVCVGSLSKVLSKQGGAKRLPNYHLVGENCVLVGESLFDLPDLVGENICLLKIYVG